jgi:hypothetical protein
VTRHGRAPGKAGIIKLQAGLVMAGLAAGSVLLIPSTAPQVSIGGGSTRPVWLTVLPGTVVQLTNTSARPQVLCTGAGSRCRAARGAPAELAPPGMVLQPGQTRNVTFRAAAAFHLISTVTAHVDVTVVVSKGAGWDGPDGCAMPTAC